MPWPAQRFRATAIGLDARIRVVRRQFTLQNKTERLQIELREESTTHEAYQRQSERDQLRLAEVEEAQARLTRTRTRTLTLTEQERLETIALTLTLTLTLAGTADPTPNPPRGGRAS